jgi:hypothetical protein
MRMARFQIFVTPTMSEADITMPTGRGHKIIPTADGCAIEGLRPGSRVMETRDSLGAQVFSFPAMLATFLVGAVYVAGRSFSVDPDLWWHIRTGELILDTHRWPTTDPYSFTVAGQPWLACEWIGDVLLAAVARLGGLQALDLLLIVLGGSVMLAIYAYATIRTGNSKAGLVVAAVLFVLANASFSLRPQMLGYLFLVLTLIALERFRQGKSRALWFLPLLMVLWVNTHGSFVIGIGAIGAYFLGGLADFKLGGIEGHRWTQAQRLRLETVFLLCLLALTLTPYGVELALYPFHVASSLPIGVANVAEWQSMPFSLAGGKIFLALVLSLFVVQIALRMSFRVEELGLALLGIVMACLHIRFLLVFVPFFTPLFATLAARWVPKYERAKDRPLLNVVLMTGAVAAMIYYFPTKRALETTVSEHFPVRAVSYMREHSVPGPLLNSYGFGGYLVWAHERVFVDGRADPYERGGSLADYFHITRLEPGALQVLRNYGIKSCLLEKSEPLATVLSALPGWQRVYVDDLSVLFVKRDAASTDGRRGPQGEITQGLKEQR